MLFHLIYVFLFENKCSVLLQFLVESLVGDLTKDVIADDLYCPESYFKHYKQFH